MVSRTAIIVCLLFASWAGWAYACHPNKNEDVSDGENQDVSNRKKRAIPIFPSLGLEDYFVLCMRSYRRFRPIDIRTIVSFTIDQTRWFESSDQSFCSSDTVSCWQNILYGYMNRNSELFMAAMQCMRRYGVYRGRQSVQGPPGRRRRYKRQLNGRYVAPNPQYYQGNARQQTGLPINLRQASDRLQLMFPGLGDFRSLIEFFQSDTICSRQFCDCTGIRVPVGEVCGQNWYTRIGAMTRMSSPLRIPLAFTLNSVIAAAERTAIEQRQRTAERTRRQGQSRLLNVVLAIYAIITRQPNVTATTTIATTDPFTNLATTTKRIVLTATTTTTTAAATTTTTTTTTESTTPPTVGGGAPMRRR